MLPDELHVLKLVWHPSDLDGEKVLPTAFRKEDLCGDGSAHVSVDRQDIAVRASMESVAAIQAEKSRSAIEAGRQSVPIRTDAKIGKMHCGAIRNALIEGSRALDVRPFPIDGNEAHCGIMNIAGRKNPKSGGDRSFFDEARNTLSLIASPAITFNDAYKA